MAYCVHVVCEWCGGLRADNIPGTHLNNFKWPNVTHFFSHFVTAPLGVLPEEAPAVEEVFTLPTRVSILCVDMLMLAGLHAMLFLGHLEFKIREIRQLLTFSHFHKSCHA